MKRLIVGGAALAALVVAGAGAYIWFSGGSGEPSTEVTAAPIITTATTAVAATEQDAESAPTTEPTAGGQVVFAIDKTQSTVSFMIDEVLRGEPTTVVGTTSEVAGEVLIDFSDPAASRLGEIVVNARTFTTGSGFRDRAVRGPILNSSDDAFEFATFTPAAVEGLPGEIAVGDTVTFAVSGDFTVAGSTGPVTFDVTVTVVSETRLEGAGLATVTRGDFGLTIPDAPGVANVSEEVQLEIVFVALAA
jgi:polyisoprenoid-binding protein YceI